jgi:hypothetical protein
VVEDNPFFWPDAAQVPALETYMDALRKSGDSVGARVTVVADGVPPGWGEPIYGKLDGDLAAAMMSINAVKGVEIGDGFAGRAEGQRASRRDDAATASCQQPCRRHPRRHFQRPAGRLCSVAFKPTSSLRLPGAAWMCDGDAGRSGHHRSPRSLRGHPRHPDREAMLALVLMDQALRHRAQCGDVGEVSPRIPATTSKHRRETIAASRRTPPRAATRAAADIRKRSIPNSGGAKLIRAASYTGMSESMSAIQSGGGRRDRRRGRSDAVDPRRAQLSGQRTLCRWRANARPANDVKPSATRSLMVQDLATFDPPVSTSRCFRPAVGLGKEYAPKFAAAGAVVIDNTSPSATTTTCRWWCPRSIRRRSRSTVRAASSPTRTARPCRCWWR